jgi:hypothetical protein
MEINRTEPIPGVYSSLAELVVLQHKARGFSFLPHQPIVLVGVVTIVIAVLGGLTFWTRRRWPIWWRAIAFWRPVHLAPLNPGDFSK